MVKSGLYPPVAARSTSLGNALLYGFFTNPPIRSSVGDELHVAGAELDVLAPKRCKIKNTYKNF